MLKASIIQGLKKKKKPLISQVKKSEISTLGITLVARYCL